MSLEPPVEHKQVIIRAEVGWWFKKDQKEEFWVWLWDLIDDQGMNIMSGPHMVYCERPGLEGWSGTAIIETSHVAIHVWDKPKNAGDPVLVQLDFYTCGQLNTDLIVEAIDQFGIVVKNGKKQIDMLTLDREYRLEVL